jgi:carbamoylphosphate synthase large subunit
MPMLGASVGWRNRSSTAQAEIHFAGILRLELVDLQIDDDKAAKPQVVAEQVDIEILAANLEVILTANEREALAEFQNQRPQVFPKTSSDSRSDTSVAMPRNSKL